MGRCAFQYALPTFTQKIGLDLSSALDKLGVSCITLRDDNDPVGSIAARHGMSPQRLFQIMQGAAPEKTSRAGQTGLPPMPFSGTGQLPLLDFCAHGRL